MKKLRLEIDALAVESFDTRPLSTRGEGTVHGMSYPNACFPPSDSQDPNLDTCHYATCAGNTCWGSCNGTCNCATAGCGPKPVSYGPTYCYEAYTCGISCLAPCRHTDEVPGCGVDTDFGCI